MSNITLSDESLLYLQRLRNNPATQSRGVKPFVSFVHDEEDSDSGQSSVMLTPKLREHSRKSARMMGDERTPVKLNLSTKLSSAPTVTPNTIYQLASEVGAPKEEGKRSSRSRSKTTHQSTRSKTGNPPPVDYDMDAVLENDGTKYPENKTASVRRSKKLPTNQRLEAQHEDEQGTLRTRSRSKTPSRRTEISAPNSASQPELKSPRTNQRTKAVDSYDEVIESVARAAALFASNQDSDSQAEMTDTKAAPKSQARRSKKSKVNTSTNQTSLTTEDARQGNVSLQRPKRHDSELVRGRESRTKTLPKVNSQLEDDWNGPSEEESIKSPRNRVKTAPKARVHSAHLEPVVDSSGEESAERGRKPSSRDSKKFTPEAPARRSNTKTPVKSNPLTLLASDVYTASEEDFTESMTEIDEAPQVQGRTPAWTMRPVQNTSETPVKSARMARGSPKSVVPEKQLQFRTIGSPTSAHATPKSILKPAGSEVPLISTGTTPKSSTLTSLEIVSSPARAIHRTPVSTVTTSTLTSFEVISSPVGETPKTSGANNLSKSILSTHGGIKRKSPCALPSESNKRFKYQSTVRRPSLNQDAIVAPSEEHDSTLVRSEPKRLNPYSAESSDPLRTRELLQNDDYRILFLELLPECYFSFRTYCKTTVLVLAGSLTIKSSGQISERRLEEANRLIELDTGVLHHLYNNGSVVAVYQMIESLKFD